MAQGELARWTALMGAILGLVAAPAVAGAATLRVAANGVDVAGCGPVAAPCRTIDQAIASAAPGDTIVVAPGRYPRTTVSKRVRLLSSRGAGATIVDAEGGDVGIEIVGNLVEANGDSGISAYVTSGGSIRGNAVTGNASTGIYGVLGTDSVVRDNIVIANGTGMGITGDVLVTRNSILSNRSRGLLAGGYQGSPGGLTASRNNFYDNGQCDIALYRSGHVDGRNNFWGTPGGPNVNPVCLGYSGTIDIEPFLPREAPVSPIKPRL